MIGEIYYIAKVHELILSDLDIVVGYREAVSKYKRGKFEDLVAWLEKQTMFQLDIETNVVQWWNLFEIISIQFGSCETGKNRVQWFVQWSELNDEQKAIIKAILEDKSKLKIIHNAKFEYIVLRFHGIVINNIFDTMLAEKVMRGGLSNEDYALVDLSWKYLRIQMNKSEQQNFGDNIITDSKILYGITDVAYLDVIRRFQLEEISQPDALGYTLLNAVALEMEALPAFADITFEGMELDVEKWRKNIALAEPIVQASHDRLANWLTQEPFLSFAISKGYIAYEDRITINYNSSQQKQALLQKLYPTLPGGTLNIIKKFVRDNAKNLSDEDLGILVGVLDKKYDELQAKVLKDHRVWLIEQGFLIPAGHNTLNWNSHEKVLELFKLQAPRIKGTGEEARANYEHIGIIRDYGQYSKDMKLIESFGEEFIQKYVGPDGKVRCNVNQVISTGRISTSNPNMQNIIVGDKIANDEDPKGTRYRNAFIAPKNFVYVDSDYTSQELCVIAFMSGDPVFLDCLSNGYDLHSVCSEMIFGAQWKQAAESTCAYYNMVVGPDGKMRMAKKKCKCLKHMALRDKVKPVNFGLAYGMTEYKLSGELGISLTEARTLIDKYFSAFPKIGNLLNQLGSFALHNGYIMTLAPFCRKRFFPYWEENKTQIEAHIMGVYNNPTLGSIEREGKNMPIQGASADMVKLAMVLIRNYIWEHNLQDYIKIVAQVHDQITTICHEDHAEWWRDKLDELMQEAALVVIPTGILKAETAISPVWTK